MDTGYILYSVWSLSCGEQNDDSVWEGGVSLPLTSLGEKPK